VVEKVIRRIGRMADGWFPQMSPADLAPVAERLRGYAVEAGRDPATIGIECGIAVKAGDDPEQWIERAEAYRALGATHLRVMTAGGGFASPTEHLDAALRWLEAVKPTN